MKSDRERRTISWPAIVPLPGGSVKRPYFEVERSGDLRAWAPVGERMRSTNGEELELQVDQAGGHGFYRVRSFDPRGSKIAATSAGVFGYSAAFDEELRRVGQITVGEFERRFSVTNEYLEKLTWDPRTGAFWEDWNADPKVLNVGKTTSSPGYRFTDYRLNAAELAVFLTNGFVVSERLGGQTNSFGYADSFADLFYDIWFNDLPVFMSTDAILQAWHRTYDSMLLEVEETFLVNALEVMLQKLSARVPEVWAEAGEGVLRESIRDVDFYLTVARSLLGTNMVASELGEEARVAETLADIKSYSSRQTALFGQRRRVDYSQFSPRGHYRHSPRLERYFQCSMWLGRIDFMVAGGLVERCDGQRVPVSARETGSAVVLWDLVQRSGELGRWREINAVIESFVGWSDSLGFGQMGGLLAGAGIRSVRDIPDVGAIERLQREILAGDLGVQNIRSDYYVSPLGPEQLELPRSFAFLGQRFTPDSWAFSQTVFDSVLWDGAKVMRRVPSALDVAFAVLGNDQTVPALVSRISRTDARQAATHAERWRDGLPYQHNLTAVRGVIDAQTPEAWESNIYMSWLKALRQLSLPTTDPRFPEAMRTRAWATKTLNTQLASWTHLRHDNVLYVKQSYTGGAVCFYPFGFVEPRVEFWETLRGTAERAATLIERLSYEGEYTYRELDAQRGTGTNAWMWILNWRTNTVPLTTVRERQTAHLRSFASTLATLAELSRKELAQISFSAEDDSFIKHLIQDAGTLPLGSGGVRKYDGWYPRLFYRALPFFGITQGMAWLPETYFQEQYGANAVDRVVVDVHTDVPAPAIGDPGGVLHEGVGTPNLLMIAIDNGPDRMVYAGPVLSHYEFEITGPAYRIDDFSWDQGFTQGRFYVPEVNRIEGLAPPPWTRGYLVPR